MKTKIGKRAAYDAWMGFVQGFRETLQEVSAAARAVREMAGKIGAVADLEIEEKLARMKQQRELPGQAPPQSDRETRSA